MSQMLGPLQQAIYVHSRLEPVGWPGQRVNEPERAWPFVPAPAARIQTSTSPATVAAANALRVSRSDADSPSDAGSPGARCAHAGWQCAPDGRDRCHAGRSAHRRTGVLAVWWTRRDAILDLRRGDVRYLWGHRETDELKGCCLSDDLSGDARWNLFMYSMDGLHVFDYCLTELNASTAYGFYWTDGLTLGNMSRYS